MEIIVNELLLYRQLTDLGNVQMISGGVGKAGHDKACQRQTYEYPGGVWLQS